MSDPRSAGVPTHLPKSGPQDRRRPSRFSRLALATSTAAGSGIAFTVALGTILIWALAGPIFGYSEGWQMVINTGTTIVTFLMIFLIQNSQNREAAAVQIKLDELIRALEGAHNAMLDLEQLDQKQLEDIRDRYARLAADARNRLTRGDRDTGVTEVNEPRDQPS